jgi:hypothetical protein
MLFPRNTDTIFQSFHYLSFFPMKMAPPFSSFILDRTAVMGVQMKMAPPFSSFMHDRKGVIGGSNENGSAIFIFYTRPQGGHWRLI